MEKFPLLKQLNISFGVCSSSRTDGYEERLLPIFPGYKTSGIINKNNCILTCFEEFWPMEEFKFEQKIGKV